MLCFAHLIGGGPAVTGDTLIQELRIEVLQLRDDRIRLDTELKTKSELLRRLTTEQENAGGHQSTPQRNIDYTWAEAILATIGGLEGKATLKQIYSEVPKYRRLAREHLRETIWSGRPAFQHGVRSFISGLVAAGKLRKVSRGIYQLTEEGREGLVTIQGGQPWPEGILELTVETDPVLAELWNNPEDAEYDQL